MDISRSVRRKTSKTVAYVNWQEFLRPGLFENDAQTDTRLYETTFPGFILKTKDTFRAFDASVSLVQTAFLVIILSILESPTRTIMVTNVEAVVAVWAMEMILIFDDMKKIKQKRQLYEIVKI